MSPQPPDPRLAELVPVVGYAIKRRIAAQSPDYWDFATGLELAVLGRDEVTAMQMLSQALIHQREQFESETTARNLRLIREARVRRGENAHWIELIEQELLNANR